MVVWHTEHIKRSTHFVVKCKGHILQTVITANLTNIYYEKNNKNTYKKYVHTN